MPSMLAFAAPFALILPVLGHSAALAPGDPLSEGQPAPQSSSAPDFDAPPEGPYSPVRPVVSPLDAFHSGQISRQVRIEQRVIIRISPQRQTARNSLLARLPQRGLTTRYEEREMDSCLPINRISGVQTGNGNRLLLFMDNRQIVSLNLERMCRARDFYSGFYVERNEDGQLCVDRDQLQSRSGAKCEVERMSQLVAVED